MSVRGSSKPVVDQIVAALQADPKLRDAVVQRLAAKHPDEFRAACARTLNPTVPASVRSGPR